MNICEKHNQQYMFQCWKCQDEETKELIKKINEIGKRIEVNE